MRILLNNKRKNINKRSNAGFSLLELIISVAIFVLITIFVLVDYGKFGNTLVLDNLAHEIALSVREAQAYAMSVRESEIGSSLFPGYGLYFHRASSTSYLLFIDEDGNELYDPGDGCGGLTTECIKRFSIGNGNRILSLCGTQASGGPTAGTGCAGPPDYSDYFHIVFTRPNPDANIMGDTGGGGGVEAFSKAEITVISPKGLTRTVDVWLTGQLSVR